MTKSWSPPSREQEQEQELEQEQEQEQEKQQQQEQPGNTSIDPHQLLASCYKIKESMDKLDKSIRLAQLRLTTLLYIGPSLGDLGNGSTFSLKCFDDLIELGQSSQVLVKQLDELYRKLKENSVGNCISLQIASQQLTYFTSEWYDNLTPKFNETFELAERVDARLLGQLDTTSMGRQRSVNTRDTTLQSLGSTELRVRKSLVRLRQSMSENERLITIIANNIEATRETIESIYGSLEVTKFKLVGTDKNVLDSIALVRSSQRCRLMFLLAFLIAATLVVYILYKIII